MTTPLQPLHRPSQIASPRASRRGLGRVPHGLLGFCVLLLLALPISAGAQAIKMATLSPEGSPWDTILERMGSQWEQGTGGRVSLQIYPGGVAGDEPDIIRKMKIGQYQAAAVSVAGLADIHKDFTVFEIPLFYRDFDEMAAVLDSLTPTLRASLDEKGFHLLGWGYVGWVYFFLTEPVATVPDMQALKILTLAGDETLVQWWRRNGFQPVALAATDILTGLKTGMVDAVTMPPLYAMQMQFYKSAPYMADLPLAPMMGAILISKRSWNRISDADKRAMEAAAQAAQDQIFDQIPKLDETAIALMKGQGMTVLEINDSEHAGAWLEAAERFADDMRGTIVPTAIFDAAEAARTKHRAGAAERTEGTEGSAEGAEPGSP